MSSDMGHLNSFREEQVLLMSGTDNGKEVELRYLMSPVTNNLTFYDWSKEQEGWVLDLDANTTIHSIGLAKLLHYLTNVHRSWVSIKINEKL